MELDLDEAVAGIDKRIEIPTLVACDTLQGQRLGGRQGRNLRDLPRPRPGAHAARHLLDAAGLPALRRARPDHQVACKECHGNGRVEEEKVLSVKIPAGVDNGDRIRLSGEGEAGPAGSPPGDLYVEVRVRPHEIFQRDGDDLHCEVPIRISQAALGDTVRVPTLDGEAEIRVPAETQSGKLFRLRDKGVQVRAQPRHRATCICRVVVETPVNLTSEQRELLEQFEATFTGEDARRHSPKSSTFVDGVKGFWERMTS